MKQMTGVDPEVIRARRKLIRDDAPCSTCGGRLEDCNLEMRRNQEAPFGCCDRCSHRSDPGALTALVKEIEAGDVRPVEEILAEHAARADRRVARQATRTTPDGKLLDTAGAMLGQGEWWLQKSGAWIRIADMSPGHRYNAAALLMRNAAGHALALASEAIFYAASHDGGDAAQDSLDRIAGEAQHLALNDPQRVIRESVLYRALTIGLKVQGDGTEPWQATGRDPVTGKKTKVPPPMTRVCPLDDCGCSGEAHA